MTFSPAFYQAIFDSMHTAVILLDKALHILYLNPAAESLLKVSTRRFHGVPLNQVFSEHGYTPEGIEKARRNSQQFTKRKVPLRLAGEEIVVDYTVTPLPDFDDSLLVEIEPLDRAIQIHQEEMLVSSQAIIQDMVRGLAHEVKNPLGGLRGAAQLLERELGQPEHKEYTQIIISEADRLGNLVNRLLGPYKAMNIQQINIHEVLQYIRKLITVEAREIPVRIDYDPSIPEIFADREQLLQVFLNIIRNAIQALANTPSPCITLKTRIQRKFTIGNDLHPILLRVDILDNGPGIPDSLAEKLFFPMVSGRAEGTGLGLSIAQSIINRHQGLIKFGRRQDQTVFSIYLPFGESNG